MPNGFEIDFLPVGEGERSGDAIVLRYRIGEIYKTLVFDGGTKDSGEALVHHITNHCGSRHVDYVVSSHPDADHASGLSVVIEKLEVGELWMHRPWRYSSVILHQFDDGRLTPSSLSERLRSSLASAHELESLARSRGIPIFEPFQGATIGPFHVLSPDKDWYVNDLIAAFEKSPAQISASSFAAAFEKAFAEASRRVASWVEERWDIETLRENMDTSAENESSVVLFGVLGDHYGTLLTGDAGVCALDRALSYAEACGLSLPAAVTFAQIPHHGSRHNVSPSVLDRLLGPRQPMGTSATKTAFVSASRGSTTHPRKAVTNAFIRRGANVFATQGRSIRHYVNMPERSNWGALSPLEFATRVESWA